MKKNKMMRIASVLLVMTLISTCAISGTFAKYVTKMSGEDSARVAKWGVVLTLDAGDVFASEYKTHDEAAKEAGIELSVKAEVAADAEEGDKLVAPGTASEDIDGSIKASVYGKPEVATRYILKLEGLKDVYLAKGDYVDYTELIKNENGEYGYFKTFNLAKDYAPVKWDLKIGNASLAAKLLEAFSAQGEQLAAYGLTADGCSFHDAAAIINKVNSNDTYKQVVENFLKTKIDGANFAIEINDDGDITLSYDVQPNVEVNYTAELVWKWAFENGEVDEETGLAEFDAADTFLGNWAAVEYFDQEIEDFEAPEDGSLEIEAKLTAIAVQID